MNVFYIPKKKHIKTRKRETTEIVMVRCWILNLFYSWVGEILIFSNMLRVLNTTSSIVHKVSIFHLKIGLKVNVIIIVWITYLRHIDKDWCNIVPSPCSYCSVCDIGWLQPVSRENNDQWKRLHDFTPDYNAVQKKFWIKKFDDRDRNEIYSLWICKKK